MSTFFSSVPTMSVPATVAPSRSLGERSAWIDHLRLAAAFAVVWIHVAAPLVVGDGVTAHDLQWWIGNISSMAMRWCVPVFVMISGMLAIPRAGEGDTWAFYKRRASRILIPTLFWAVFYQVWEGVRTGQFNLWRMLISVVSGRAYYHLWFLYMLAGFYLTAPLLAFFVAQVRRRTVVLAVVLAFALASCHLILHGICNIWSPALAFWGRLAPYFLAGYLLADRRFVQVTGPTLVVAAAVSTALMALLMGVLWPVFSSRTAHLVSDGGNPLVIIQSLAVFLLFRGWGGESSGRGGRLMASAAPFMLGIYAIHPLCIELLGHFGITGTAVPAAIGIPFCSALVFFLSLAACLGLAILPGGRRLVT